MAKEKMTVAQLVDIMGILWKMLMGGEISWDSVSCETAQHILKDDPRGFTTRFVQFIANGGRLIFGGLKVACVPLDLQKFIGNGWAFWKGPKDGKGLDGEEERDKASLLLSEVDLGETDFLTCLEKGESSITGEEKLICLRKLNRPIYGTTQFMGLWRDYQQKKAESVLEKLYQQKGITYIDFFGDVLRDPGGDRDVLFLYRCDDGSWLWHYFWLDIAWRVRDFTAVSQQVSS